MSEIKEKIKMNDGTEKEVTIIKMGFKGKYEILQQVSKTQQVGRATTNEMQMFALLPITIEKYVKGIDNWDEVEVEEGERIFNTYYADAWGIGNMMGNSNETSD